MGGLAFARAALQKRPIPRVSGLLVLTFGITVLCCWILGLDAWLSVYQLLLPMKANTAAAVSLLALTLFVAGSDAALPARRQGAFWLRFLVSAIAAATLAEYIFEWNLGIDQILAIDDRTQTYPGRMSPLTALVLLLLCCAQSLGGSTRRHRIVVSQSFCMLVVFLSTVTLFAYLYDAPGLIQLGHYVPMAWSTALCLLLLGLGTITLHPHTGLISPLFSNTLAARMGRRLLVSAWLTLPFIAWLRIQGQDRNWYGTEFGVALLVSTGLAMMSAFIFWHTSTAEHGERRVQYLNRLYSVLSEVNSLIVRVSERNELFQEACTIAVERGGFPCAWFGLVNPETGMVDLVARRDAGHLAQSAQASLGERLSLRQGDAGFTPIGRAVHGGHPVVSNDVEADSAEPFRQQLLADGIRSYAIFPLSLDGKVTGIFKLHAEITHFFHDDEIRLLNEMAGDITFALNHLEQRRRLDHLAYFDSLTGLANARLFEERLYHAIDNARRHQSALAVIVFDLISFRSINRAHGRQVGDQTLQILAQRLTHCCGETGGARLGSNLFAVLIANIATEAGIVKEYERIAACCFGDQFAVFDNKFALAARAGIAILHADGEIAKTLLDNAESALRAARDSGQLYRFHNPASNQRNVARLDLHAHLSRALADAEFSLHYQVKVDSKTMLPCGAEALLRWHSAALGVVAPSIFVPVLEEVGLIGKVGAWALQQASKDSSRVVTPACPGFRIAVNISASQLMEDDFVDKVQHAFGEYIHMAEIDLELTESLIMSDIDASIVKLRQLRSIGLKIAIDDFGTGYSSMAYLARLPLDYLKIDRAFVMGLPDDVESMTVISSIISLGHALGLQVIAEGIEHAAQAHVLAALGCDQLQGYHFGRPEPLPALLAKLDPPRPLA